MPTESGDLASTQTNTPLVTMWEIPDIFADTGEHSRPIWLRLYSLQARAQCPVDWVGKSARGSDTKRETAKPCQSQGAKGERTFVDASGKPVDLKTADPKKPVCSVRTEGNTATVEFYATPADALAGKSFAREEMRKEQTDKFAIERKTLFKTRSGDSSNPVQTVESTLDKSTGEISVRKVKTGEGQEVIRFDQTGKAIGFEAESGDRKIRCELVDGRVTKVFANGEEVPADKAETLIALAETSIALARKEHQINEAPEDPLNLLRPTEAKAGDKPTGTLVWREATGSLQQAHVDAGVIKDENGNKIGTVTDAGLVTLLPNAQQGRGAPLTFKIQESEGAAFHGIASDGTRLDLVSKDLKTGFTGEFTSADKKERLAVIANSIYDKTGKFVGRMGEDGKVEIPSNDNANHYVAINSFREGWTFEGEQDGKKRNFTTSSDTVNGKIFIPEKPNAPPTEYEVQMGMLINRQTRELCGWISAPKQRADGTLEGGAILQATAQGLVETPLAARKNAVFELTRLGETGVEGKAIAGICLGAERQADGSLRHGQGYFNISHAVAEEGKRQTTIQGELEELKNKYSWRYQTGWNNKYIREHEKEKAQCKENSQAYLAALKTGHANVEDLTARAERTKVTLAGSALKATRDNLDRTQANLERLPDDPQLIRSGWVNVPKKGGGTDRWTIENGKLYDSNKKEIGRFDSGDGVLTVLDPETGKEVKTEMKNLRGAVWHLAYEDRNGRQQTADWVSLGARDGIASRTDMINRAEQEYLYAWQVNRETNSTETNNNLSATRVRQVAFDKRVNSIFTSGVVSDSDLQFLTDGPAKHVRATALQDGKVDKPARIEVVALDTQEKADQVDGKLRIGNDVFQIEHGKLYRLHEQDKREEKACGQLLAGYRVAIEGRGVLNLAEENRVLMQFRIGKNEREHQILGLGNSRLSLNQGFVSGGLMDVKEMNRQAREMLSRALKGDTEYLSNRPAWTAAICEWALGGRDEQLAQFVQSMSSNQRKLETNLQDMFKTGFNTQQVGNDRLDTSVMLAQSMLHGLGVEASDTEFLSKQGQQIQSQVNDGVVMAGITLATMGVGSAFSGLANGARIASLGRFGTVLMYAGEVGASSLAGGTISTILRDSDSSSASANFKSGCIEGALIAVASIGGRSMGTGVKLKEAKEVLELARSGAQLTEKQAKLLLTVERSVTGRLLSSGYSNLAVRSARGAYMAGNSFGQGAGFGVAGAIRQGQGAAEGLASGGILTGAMTNILGELIGQRLSGLMKSEFARETVESLTSNLTTGTMDGISPAMQEQDRQTAERLGMPVEWLSESLKHKHRNYLGIVEEAMKTGAISTISAPIIAAVKTGSEHAHHRLTERNRPNNGGGTHARTGSDRHSARGNEGDSEGRGERTGTDRPGEATPHVPEGTGGHGRASAGEQSSDRTTQPVSYQRCLELLGRLSARPGDKLPEADFLALARQRDGDGKPLLQHLELWQIRDLMFDKRYAELIMKNDLLHVLGNAWMHWYCTPEIVGAMSKKQWGELNSDQIAAVLHKPENAKAVSDDVFLMLAGRKEAGGEWLFRGQDPRTIAELVQTPERIKLLTDHNLLHVLPPLNLRNITPVQIAAIRDEGWKAFDADQLRIMLHPPNGAYVSDAGYRVIADTQYQGRPLLTELGWKTIGALLKNRPAEVASLPDALFAMSGEHPLREILSSPEHAKQLSDERFKRLVENKNSGLAALDEDVLKQLITDKDDSKKVRLDRVQALIDNNRLGQISSEKLQALNLPQLIKTLYGENLGKLVDTSDDGQLRAILDPILAVIRPARPDRRHPLEEPLYQSIREKGRLKDVLGSQLQLLMTPERLAKLTSAEILSFDKAQLRFVLSSEKQCNALSDDHLLALSNANRINELNPSQVQQLLAASIRRSGTERPSELQLRLANVLVARALPSHSGSTTERQGLAEYFAKNIGQGLNQLVAIAGSWHALSPASRQMPHESLYKYVLQTGDIRQNGTITDERILHLWQRTQDSSHDKVDASGTTNGGKVTWKDYAARLAWKDALEGVQLGAGLDPTSAAEQAAIARFNARLQELVGQGRNADRERFLSRFADTESLVALQQPMLNYEERRVLVATVDQLMSAPADAQPPSGDAAVRRYELIKNLNGKAYAANLRRVLPYSDIGILDPSALQEQVRTDWVAKAVFNMTSVFQGKSEQWINAYREQRDRNTSAASWADARSPFRLLHDATHWLPSAVDGSGNRPAAGGATARYDLRGLDDFLLRYIKENNVRDLMEKLKRSAQAWPRLIDEHRRLPLDDLDKEILSHAYERHKDHPFAIEAVRWAVDVGKYPGHEERYLRSKKTPPIYDTNARWTIKEGNSEYTARFLPRDDPRGVFLGQHTNCCQYPDGLNPWAAWHGQESAHGGFFVIENKEGEIVAQSWAWVSADGGLCFDSCEAKGLSPFQNRIVCDLMRSAAPALLKKFHTITLGMDSGKLTVPADWGGADDDQALKPQDYSEKRDSHQQVIIASRQQRRAA